MKKATVSLHIWFGRVLALPWIGRLGAVATSRWFFAWRRLNAPLHCLSTGLLSCIGLSADFSYLSRLYTLRFKSTQINVLRNAWLNTRILCKSSRTTVSWEWIKVKVVLIVSLTDRLEHDVCIKMLVWIPIFVVCSNFSLFSSLNLFVFLISAVQVWVTHDMDDFILELWCLLWFSAMRSGQRTNDATNAVKCAQGLHLVLSLNFINGWQTLGTMSLSTAHVLQDHSGRAHLDRDSWRVVMKRFRSFKISTAIIILVLWYLNDFSHWAHRDKDGVWWVPVSSNANDDHDSNYK